MKNMIKKSFICAFAALATLVALAFDTPYLTFRSASQFRLSGTSSRWSSGTLDIATSNPTDEASWTKGWTGTQVTAVQTDGQYYIYLRGTGITAFGGSSYYGSPFSLTWVTTSADVYCEGDIETLRGYNGDVPAMGEYCYRYMFSGWTDLASAPTLSATTLANYCYQGMFSNCKSLKAIPNLPATTSATSCYGNMFQDCASLEVNTEGPGVEWSIPSGFGSTSIMFGNTAGTFTGSPTPGKTYFVASALPYGQIYQVSGSGALGVALVGRSSSINLAPTVKNGAVPYTFTLASGTLPLGMEVSGSTLSGTPTAAGNYEFSLSVTDSESHPASVLDYTLRVLQPTIVETAYVGGSTPSANCIQLTTDMTTLDQEWYVASGTLNFGTGGIKVFGNVNLILADSASVTVMGAAKKAGVNVAPGNSLTIYGQVGGAGTLTASGYSSDGFDYGGAGIGGNDKENCGTVTINGGTINATGSQYTAAGIGGGKSGNGGTVTINGGTVTATGGSFYGAGIGGGQNGSGGTVTINGGTVTATAGSSGSGTSVPTGIGKGCYGSSAGTLTVGSTVSVKAGASANPTTEIGRGGSITIGTQRYFFVESLGLVQETSALAAYVNESKNWNLADTITGGTTPYIFSSVVGFEPPTGLTLDGTTLSGSVAAADTYTIKYTVTDSSATPLVLDAVYTLTVTTPDPLSAQTDLGAVKIGKSKSVTLSDTISGGVPPYTFDFNGAHNAAFSLAAGVLTFTPTAAQNYSCAITVTDALGSTLPVTYTVAAVEAAGFTDDDPEEPETGDSIDCLTLDGVFPRTCHQVTSSSTAVTWEDSWYYVTGNVTLSAGAIVSGKVSLILCDGATLTVTQSTSEKAGINVSEGNSLVIYSQSKGSNIGKLEVNVTSMYGAGIGGNQYQSAGKIVIYGGDVDTNSGFWGAAIGGGNGGNGGTVEIYDGTVTAAGYFGPGIGAGKNGNGGEVTVNGGTVLASCSNSASYPGIGSSSSQQGTLTIGANVVVKAGASSTPTDIKNPNGETSISLATKYQYYLIEKQGPVALSQTTSAFAAVVGQAFEQSIAGTVSGGTSPYSFTLKSQTLSEKGLSFADGVISGTPSATGTATVTVTVSDSATGADHQSEDFTYTVTITYPPKSITYIDSRDGTTELTGLVPAQYTPGTAATLPATATAPTGYNFDGWYVDASCTGDAVTSVATTETEDKTYYAKWTPVVYTITYRDGASTMSGLAPTTYTIESTDITIPTPATKTGYEFVSWHTSSLLTPASAVTTIPHGSTGNKTFYSKWSLVPVNAPYKDGNGNTAYVSSTPLETTSTSLSTGWYIATGSVTIPSTVTVSGDVKLILEDGCSLTVNGSSSKAGINVPPGASLTIYAQANGTGSLTATAGSDGAGIGGNSGAACGSVTIYGGNVTAQTASTSQYGAGIGGGKNGNGGTVTIYGGTVIARAQYSIAYGAGIGGGAATSLNTGNGGTVMIYGGTVTAESYRGAGIGGGNYNSGATVTINGGTVTATSSSGGAGIGGGYYGSGATVTINGGTVTATGGSSTSSTAGYIASGIGKGFGSASSYTDGTLTVGVGMKAYVGSSANPTDELGSSRSYRYYVVKAGPLTQSVSAIKASAGEACNIDLAATVLGGSGTYMFEFKTGDLPSGLEIVNDTELSGTVANVGTYVFTLVVTDTTTPTPQTIDAEYTLTVKRPGFIDEDPEEPTSGDTVSVDCRNADGVVRKRTCHPVTSSDTAVTWENSWYYVTGNVTLSKGAIVSGKVSLVLADGAALTVIGTTSTAGIAVTNGNSIVIYGQTEGTGALNASSGTSSSYYASGIGGNRGDNGNMKGECGNIVICGGHITAQGGYYGAGIGGGYYGGGGTVTIYGGTVTATGGYNGAGIGGGQYKNGGTVTVYDGTITANGGTNGAGIGGGSSAAGGRVNVYGGNIEATGGSGSYTVGIGRGNGSNKTNGAGLYVYDDDAVIKTSSSATATLTTRTPNATTHEVTISTSSSYKYVRITGPLPMVQKTTSLGTAWTGELKNITLATSTYSSYIQDGKMPYTFDPANSTLPEGFSLTAAGVLSGRPSSAGNYEFDIAVTDSTPNTTNFTFTLTVSDPNPIAVATTDYGSITKGTYFYHTIQPTGGVSSYTFSAVQAELPPGITCYTEAGVGVLSGTCNTPGDYEFTVTVTDAALPANVQPIAFHLEIKDVYPITYYDEGGVETLSLNPATYVQDAGLATLPTPVKEGSAFLNWYDNAGLHGAPVTSIPATSTGPVALYSKWYTPVSGNIEVTFTGASGTPQTETCTVITPSMAAYDSSLLYNNTYSNITLSSGWYVVANVDTLPQKVSIVINGEVNLVLMDDRSLTVTKPANHKSGNCMSGIVLLPDNTLNVYGQTKGTGTLTANGFNSSAGIGGYDYSANKACGTLKVYGGTVVANGGSGAAGIGGSASADGAGGTVEIYGGTVTATGSNGGAGIGSGGNALNSGVAANGGTVKIYGGTVTATGSAFSYSGPRVGAGAGIGGGGGAGQGGSGGTVEIYGGNVTAIGGVNESASAAGIGGGNGADSQGTLKVSGQYAVVYAGDDASSATERTPDANDMVALDGSPYYEIQGEGAAPVTYNITYMSAGESQYWLEPNNYTHGTAQTLATPDPREGYTFDGWFVDDQFNGDPVVEVPANATGDKTFYAKWTPVVYTITYYSIVGDEKTEITSLAPATYTAESGATLPTEISVVREGWVFDGWASYTSGPQVTGIEPGTTGNKTFYVRWDVADFGLFDGEIYLDACFEDEVDLADTIHKGTAPYTFALKSGEELPTGLTLESDGTLSGTPTAAGIYEVVITVTDSSEPKRTIDAIYTIEVMLSKTTGISGADATVAIGFPVEIDLASAIRGGTAPYSFEVATDLEGNALPSGLVLNGNTLEGTSTMRGNAFFALNVTDSKGYSSYLYYTIYSQSDSAQRTDTVNGIEWGYVSSSLPKQAGRLSIWNSSSLASDGMHAISANTEGCVYVPDGSCLWTGREPVTCIGRNAFKNCDKITRVTLPATITDIGENAFDGCTALKAVVIPSSDILEHINTNAFAGATSLEHIYVGKGDKAAFTALLEASGYAVPNENFILECDFYKLTLDTNLGDELDMPVLTKAYTETIYLPNVGNLPVPTRNRYTFDGWYTEKFGGIRINADDTLSGGDWTLYAHWTTDLPDPVFSIANDFDGNPVLQYVTLNRNTEVTLPDGVDSVGGAARTANGGYLFTNSYDRSIIQRVTMPSSVKRIRLMAFADCPNLSEVYLSNALTNIGLSAFEHCGSLKGIDIPGTVDLIDRYAFFGCSNMVDLVIGNGVREIGDGAFYNCRSLVGDGENGLVIPNSVKIIGDAAFMYAGMRNLIIPKGATIGPRAFSYCKNLESVNIGGVVVSPPKKLLARNSLLAAASSNPDAITIGKNAFSGNKALTSAVIGSTVEEIGGGAFAGCENLATITMQGNDNYTDSAGLILTKDGTTLVSAYGSNTSATVPAGVTTIAEFAFAGDKSVTNAVLPSGVTTIGEAAFSNATQFASIAIPSTVTSIGVNAFYDTVLATVYVSKGDVSRVSGLIVASGRSVSGVEFVEMEDALEPSISGDSGATVTGDATSGYEVVPSTTSGTVEVEVPAGLDADKVTVVVPPTASVKPNGANVKVVKTVDATSYDITAFLDIPAADANGVVNLGEATVKDEIVEEVLDPEEGAVLVLTAENPSITTAETRAGLTYTLWEGTTLENMAASNDPDATKVGDGNAWTPKISVKGGTSGFYSVHVTK